MGAKKVGKKEEEGGALRSRKRGKEEEKLGKKGQMGGM